MKKSLFTGCATALITPFCDGQIDTDALASLLERQLSAGVSGIVAAGTTGECATLSGEEYGLLLRSCSSSLKGRVPLIAGIGGNDTEHALQKALLAQTLGADAVLLSTPYYNKANEEGLYRHFTYVADRISVPLIVYNIPSRTGIGCTIGLYRRLAKHENIIGIKEASGDLALVGKTIAECGDALAVWSGSDELTLPMLALGAQGTISVVSNILPRETEKLCTAALSGDFAEARALHEALLPLTEALFFEVNPIPVKTALSMLGMCREEFRLPLYPMNAVHKDALRQVLVSCSLLN